MKKKQIFIVGLFAMAAASGFADSGEFTQWQFKLGGEERFRYEYRYNFNFNDQVKDNSTQMLNRLRVHAMASLTDEYLNKKLDVFVEGMDARDWTYLAKGIAGQSDPFDLHQAYVYAYNVLASDLDVKLGRMEFNYGEKRLIASPTWLNNLRAWDGAVLHYHKNGLFSDLIYGQTNQLMDKTFNGSDGQETLAGIYSGYQKNGVSPLLEWYFLNQNDSRATSDIHRYVAGARLKVKLAEDTKLDVEVPYEWGKTGTTASMKTVRAYAFHANLAKTFSEVTWKPLLNLAYDEASGNKDPNSKYSNTFVPLYQTVHEPYGLMDFFRWQNVRNPEVGMTLYPLDKFRFTSQADFFWLQSKYDSWYNSTGGVVRTKTSGDRGYFVGNEASVRLYYDLNKNVSFEGGYAHFFPGGFARDSGADDGADFVYSQTVLKF